MKPSAIARTACALSLALAGLAAGGCAGKKKDAVDLTPVPADAAYAEALAALNERDLRKAKNRLERIEYTPEDRSRIEPLARLALADATYYAKTDIALIDARNLYLEFVTLNGNHELAPYAQLQVGTCSLGQVRHPSRDQTQTYQAIADLEEVIRRFPSSHYAEAARGLLAIAHSNLAESEFIVGKFYMKRKAYLAAAERFRDVIEEYPDYVEREKALYHLGRTLLLSHNPEGRIYLSKLVQEYPDSAFVGDARKALGESVDLVGSVERLAP